MPQKRNSTPPPVMTWMKASPVLAISLIFDALRFLFEQFWFFGPALAAFYCTSKISGAVSTVTAGILGTKTALALCGAAAGVAGYFGSAAIETFGVIMAIAVGLLGWLTIGLILLMSNNRIFKENEGHALWFVVSLLISETPIIGSIPGFTIITFKMYRTQIKKDRELFEKYQKEQAARELQEKNQRITELMQAQAADDYYQETEEDEEGAEGMESATERDEKSSGESEEADIQFETLKDALSELNDKQDRTKEENHKLLRAREIMTNENSIMGSEREDPVLMAAHRRFMMGQKVFDGTYENRNGFKFSNVHAMGFVTVGTTTPFGKAWKATQDTQQGTTDVDSSEEEIPEETREAA